MKATSDRELQQMLEDAADKVPVAIEGHQFFVGFDTEGELTAIGVVTSYPREPDYVREFAALWEPGQPFTPLVRKILQALRLPTRPGDFGITDHH